MSYDPIDKLLDDAMSGHSLLQNRDVLQTRFYPDVILHRGDELAKIIQSLLPILKKSKPSNLLVYGKPGTGKTLVVTKAISKIKTHIQKEKIDFPISLVYVNAKDESTMYGLLVSFGLSLGIDQKELPTTGLSISILFNKILDAIKEKLSNVVFVIDEIDYLAELAAKTGKDILYQFTRANTRLIDKDTHKAMGTLTLIGISNDLTFKERLDPRVISSLNEEELVFTNYTTQQIKEILEDRAKSAFVQGALEEAALNLCAAMAGREHGDARRAIDLLRVAGEIAEREQSEKVTEEHIRAAAQKMEEDKEVTALKSYPLHEKLLILAIMKSDDGSTGEIYTRYKDLCKKIRQKELTSRRVTQMLGEIEMSGIIIGRIIHQGIHGRTKKYKLMVSPETVKDTFKNEVTLEDII